MSAQEALMDPPASAFSELGLQAHATPCFLWGLGIWT